ncbi:ABC transporter permease [Spirochaeta isovalerica]|uniref:Putative aldouronate transport system permease protein n=1 Tax=Spirochaeta isovalerica TaxID=150 RepID=A0A841RAI0_9SPIO|nr:ABC transporter permease subunit [Spirochaeta isovalerica]MBB6480020.1 putative aldouronate transport system permease protein [Spirochaeta isovalerica]
MTRNKLKKKSLINQKELWIMLIPVLLYFVLFKYLPMGGVIIAFQRYSPFRGVAGSPWVGFEYFRQFFSSIYFGRVLRNTLMIGLFDLAFGFPAPIILALLLNGIGNKTFKKATQTVTLLPHFVSYVVVAGIALNMLSPSTGVINAFRMKLGLDSIYFMQESKYFWGIFTSLRIIKESGFAAIIYLAALSAIDPTLYEAARCDGASRPQQLRHVTLPGIIPTIVIMFIIKVGKIISISFEQVLLLQNDVILDTSEVISTLVYRRGLVNADYSYATAVGLFETFVALVLVLSSNAIARRMKSESSLW